MGRWVTAGVQLDGRKMPWPRGETLLKVLGLAAGSLPHTDCSLATERTHLALFPPPMLGVRMK